MNLLFKFINALFNKPTSNACTVHNIPDTSAPTESDKFSPSSSFTLTALYTKLLRDWPQHDIFTVANTNSMEPFIDANTIVIGEKVAHHTLQVGDVCVYNADPSLWGRDARVLHQIKSIRSTHGKPEFKFQGVNNFREDPGWVKKEDIIARIVAINYAQKNRDD